MSLGPRSSYFVGLLIALSSSAPQARPAATAGGLILDGTLSGGGVPNRFHEAIDLGSGFNKQAVQMGDSEGHSGFDAQPWDE